MLLADYDSNQLKGRNTEVYKLKCKTCYSLTDVTWIDSTKCVDGVLLEIHCGSWPPTWAQKAENSTKLLQKPDDDSRQA